MFDDFKELLSAFNAHSVKYLGREPVAVDILPGIAGVVFDEAWERRVEGVVDAASGLTAFFISKADLIASKLPANRRGGRRGNRQNLRTAGPVCECRCVS
jgi:hypothetical protein